MFQTNILEMIEADFRVYSLRMYIHNDHLYL